MVSSTGFGETLHDLALRIDSAGDVAGRFLDDVQTVLYPDPGPLFVTEPVPESFRDFFEWSNPDCNLP